MVGSLASILASSPLSLWTAAVAHGLFFQPIGLFTILCVSRLAFLRTWYILILLHEPVGLCGPGRLGGFGRLLGRVLRPPGVVASRFG